MGLASSQARLLLLTARKSDLEYRSQMISQRKITLAMNTEALATDYTKALSNRQLNFVFSTNQDKAETEVLNYSGLTSENEASIGKYIVTDSSGRLVVPATDKLPSNFESYEKDGKTYAKYYTDKAGTDAAGNPTTQRVYGQSYEVLTAPGVTNVSLFQNALRNGGLFIQKLDADDQQFKSYTWQGSDNIQDKLYTEDDDEAQSKYETESLKIQNQDKILDLELKQIETQHKAIETEYDSVKKVIDKNIEISYKIFANG